MGTWQAGKRMWVGVEDTDSIKTIRAAYEAGITTIDTAEVYGEGHSEQIVAEALSLYPEQALDNVLAAKIKLSAAQLAEIDAIGRIVTAHLDNSPIMWN